MSVAALANETLSLYRYTPGTTHPVDTTGTWAKVTDLNCYVSWETLKRVNDDGSIVIAKIARFRIDPYTIQEGDEIYYNSEFYDILTSENFDELDMEQVIRGNRKKLSPSEITTRIGS